MFELTLIMNWFATVWMTGIIWFVQVVHYPLMASVGESTFVDYERAHTRLTSYIVGPAMILEVVTAIFLFRLRPLEIESYWLLVGLILILIIWFATGVFSVPLHSRLAKSFDAKSHKWLVRSNWIRTGAWTARAALMSWLVWRVLRS